MQVDHRHFDVSFGCFVFGLRSLAFQKITLGIESFVFHYWGGRSFVPATAVGFAMDIRRITADRDIVPISYGASPFHQICRVQKCRKMRSCGLYFKKTGIQYSLSY